MSPCRRCRVADEHVGQLVRTAESDTVPRRDRVGNDAESLGGHLAQERRREEPVTGAEDEPCWDGWQGVKWPRAVVGGVRLRSFLAHGLLSQRPWHVVIEANER